MRWIRYESHTTTTLDLWQLLGVKTTDPHLPLIVAKWACPLQIRTSEYSQIMLKTNSPCELPGYVHFLEAIELYSQNVCISLCRNFSFLKHEFPFLLSWWGSTYRCAGVRHGQRASFCGHQLEGGLAVACPQHSVWPAPDLCPPRPLS